MMLDDFTDVKNPQAILDAVNALLVDPQACLTYVEILLLLPTAHVGARFTGPRAILNPLVELAVENFGRFERVIGLLDQKRGEQGLPRLGNAAEMSRSLASALSAMPARMSRGKDHLQ
jgi:hypothetical protein